MTLRPLENFNLRSSVKFAKLPKLKPSPNFPVIQYTGMQMIEYVYAITIITGKVIGQWTLTTQHDTHVIISVWNTGYSGPEDHYLKLEVAICF